MRESMISSNIFNSQDSDLQIFESNIFYKNQEKYVEENGIKYNKSKDYICKQYYQYLVESYISNKDKEIVDKDLDWNYAKALDIHIRHCMTHSSFIQYNNEMKGNFYSNAMYRLQNFTIRTYKPEIQSAFVYFTSTINNAFKEEINSMNKQNNIRKHIKETKGLDCLVTNIEDKDRITLEKDYELKYGIGTSQNESLFIQELRNIYTLKPIKICEDQNVPRFKRKHIEYDYFIEVLKDKENHIGVIVEYIDLEKMNERSGITRKYLQHRNIIARKNGHQIIQIFSDLYHDKEIENDKLFDIISNCVNSIKQSSESIGKYRELNLMISYIPPKHFLDNLEKITEPVWWPVIRDNKSKFIDDMENYKYYSYRGLSISQSAESYLEILEMDKTATRIYDSGKLQI